MEETTNKSGLSTGMIIGIAVIVAIVFGGGAYAYVNNKAEKEKKDLNAQITELQSQVTSAKTAATTTPSSSTSTTAATDETASWKTYTNDTYNYSIKYDTGWTVAADQGKGSEPNRLSWVELQNKTTFGDAAVVVEVLKNTYSDINAWAQAMNNNDLGATYTVQDTIVAGIGAKKLSTSAEGGVIRTGLIKGDNLYIIHLIYTFNQKEKTQLDSAYGKMLSSFKFLK